MSDATRRALVICGLVREPDRFGDYLAGVLRLGRPDLRVIFSSWAGELERHPGIADLLARLDAEVVVQSQPNLKLPGHMLHQVATLDAALARLDDDVFVLKTRPDICGVMDVHEFLDLAPLPAPSGRLGTPFGHRVHVVGMFAAQPLYINDIIFAGMAGDLRRLCALSFLHGLKYPRLAPEQWLWATVFAPGNPVLEAYLSVNPGLVFGDAAQQQALQRVLEASALFAMAVAVTAVLVRDSLSYFHPDPRRGTIAAAGAAHTLEALLWAPLALAGLDPHPVAATNTCLSAGLMDVIHDGTYRASPFGERVRLAVSRYGGPGGRAAMQGDRAALAAAAAALRDAVAPLGIAGHPPPWSMAETGAGYAAALEDEVNRLRRTVERLQAKGV